MEPDSTVTLADFTGPITDPGGGRYEQFIGANPPSHDPFADYLDGPVFDRSLFALPSPADLRAAAAVSLAHNLDVRRRGVWACWGTDVQVGWIGDVTHKAECSDHNADAAGIVHAIDVMVTGARAEAVVAALLADPDDLQYVIHNRVIWSVTVGWEPRAYTGVDPHTNHVHCSGKHGGSHSNSATCTGYNLTAQAASPTFDICTTPGGDTMDPVTIKALAKAIVDEFLTRDLGKPGGGDTVGVVLQTGVLQNGNKIVALLGDIAAKLTPAA